MARIVSYRDLEVWQKAMSLIEHCYKLSLSFPQEERFGLTIQLRRAAISIASNIAEGHRRSRPAYVQHLTIALGSHAELETQLELARRLSFLNREQAIGVQKMTGEVGRLLHGLVRSLDSGGRNPQSPNP